MAAELAAAAEQERVAAAVGGYRLGSANDELARYPQLLSRVHLCTDIAVLQQLCVHLYSDLEKALLLGRAKTAGLEQLQVHAAAQCALAEACADQQKQTWQHAHRMMLRVEQLLSGPPSDPDGDEPGPASGDGTTEIELQRLSGVGLLGRINQVFVLKLTEVGGDGVRMPSQLYVLEREVVSIYGPSDGRIIPALQQKASDLKGLSTLEPAM